MTGSTVEFKVHFRNGDRGRKRIRAGGRPPKLVIEEAAVPRISRLMALAIHFDGLIRDGVVADYADLARLGGVSRARITQIMNLLNLAPEIQEVVLAPIGPAGSDPCTERQLRNLAVLQDWTNQRRIWEGGGRG